MELTTLLSKTEFLATNLTVYEFRLLTYLLARVNKAKMLTHGYLAWPGTDDIIKHTGMSSPTIERIRKTLVAAGWMKYISGKGPNSSNHYYINAQMIVDAAVKSGERCPDGIVAPTIMEESSKKPHKRNTAGLVQNKVIVQEVLPVVPIVVDKPIEDVKIITSGFRKQCYGVWCNSQEEWNEVKRKKEYEMSIDNDPDCPF